MFNLTTPQVNIWNLQKFHKDTSIQNICGAVLYDELLDKGLLEQAINEEIRLQSGLRLKFTEETGSPVQYIEEYSYMSIDFEVFDSQADFERYAENYATVPFPLINSPMCRFVIFELNGCSGIIVCASHLISDAWTFSILTRDIFNIYRKLAANEPIDLPEHNYADYVRSEENYLNSERYDKDRLFWEEKYANKLERSLIKIQQTPIVKPTAKRIVKQLAAEDTSAIDEFCLQNNVSQAVLFEAAIISYLYRINRENKTITIGIPVLNRNNIAEKNTVGMFISTMPLTVDVFDKDTAALLCDKIADCHSQIFRHQKYPYSHILQKLRENSDFTGNPYDVMVSYQNAKTNTNGKTWWFSNGFSETPLTFHIDNRDSSDCYTLTVDYQTEIFKHDEEIGFLIDRLIYIIKQIIFNSDTLISDFKIVPKKEYKKIVYDFNNTDATFNYDKPIQRIISEIAIDTPSKMALTDCDKVLNFSDVNIQSNRIANSLIKHGVCHGDTIAIVLPRKAYFITSMIGILKAGAAYMPVAYDYPVDRICYMAEVSKARYIITTAELMEKFPNSLNIASLISEQNAIESNVKVYPDDVFCALHTSGSTGKPKMATLTHKNVLNFIFANRKMFDGISQVICSTIVTFDAFFQETLAALSFGLHVVLLNEDQVTNQIEFEKVHETYNHTFSFFTPTKISNYIKNSQSRKFMQHIDTFCIGGEVISGELIESLINNHTTKNASIENDCAEEKSCQLPSIYNVYGPTETTVWVTTKKIESTSPSDITIGKPISNLRVYILDSMKRVVPIGVAGEICISGNGVGKGYLNQPEFTQEKYVSDPFDQDKIMYCTGDLGRYNTQGEIEFLGRIDTQVKIRGLRIELEEIEAVMNSYEDIDSAVVSDKRDDNGRQYLVGYYTSNISVNEKLLREHLGKKLPRYMVPNYFVRLDRIPLTSSGKIARKSLPLPTFTSLTSDDYVAPTSEQETILCNLLEELLSIEKVGATEDFFDLGGDSLKAIEYMAQAHTRGVDFALQNIFDYPTVRGLCGFIENGEARKTIYSAEDFSKFNEILSRNVIDESFAPVKRSLGNVLLTGATGFLGAHILDSLMKNEDGKIYCLVRSQEKDDRRGRLCETLNYYFGNVYDHEIDKRIIPIIGDIEQIGLSDSIPNDVQTVIHTAATVKHYGSYDYFRNVNVLGTKNVIAYAQHNKAKLIHISTLSVSGNSLADEFEVYYSPEEKNFYESSLFIDQPLENVYVRSKFEAEGAVIDAMLNGLDAKIIRVGNLTNRSTDFRFQQNYRSNAFLTRFKAAVELGKFPDYLLSLYAEFSPIDKTAEGVVKIAEYADKQSVFHLNNNRPIYFDKLMEVLQSIDIEIQIVSGEVFNSALEDAAEKSNTRYLYEAFQNDMDKNGKLVYDSNIHIKNEFTVWFMKKVGFEWRQIDKDYISGYVNYFRKLGYLEV